MKKLFIIGLAALFCLALAGPTVAAVKVGGGIAIDFGMVNFSKEAYGPVEDDVRRVEFLADKIWTRFNARYESDDGKVIGMIEVRGGATAQTYNPVTGQASYNDDIAWSYAYIVWRPVKNQSFQIGYQTMLFADQAPGPYPLIVAFTRGTTATGYGEFNHATRIAGFRWMTRFSDAVRFELALYNPGNSDGFGDFQDPTFSVLNPVLPGSPPGPYGPGQSNLQYPSAREESLIPRIDAKLPMYFGGARVCVAGTYGQQNYLNMGGNVITNTQGTDESFNVYGFSANVKWPIGIFTLTAEGFWGQNLGASSWGAAMGNKAPFSQPIWNPLTLDFEDSKSIAGWIGASVKLGPGSLGGYFSYIKDKNDLVIPGIINEPENARNSWGINYILPLGKGFVMRPVFNYYNGGDLKNVGTTDIDEGTIWNAGINFQLSF